MAATALQDVPSAVTPGIRVGGRTPPNPEAQPCFLAASTLQHEGLFLSFPSIYCVRAVWGWRRLWCLLCDCFLPAHNLLP